MLDALKPVGEGNVVENHESLYLFYDTFDWRLYGRGLTLIASECDGDDRLQVWQRGKTVPVAGVPGMPGTGFVADLPAGKLQAVVNKRAGVRRLLPRLQLRAQCQRVGIINGDQKTVLRLTLETLGVENPDKPGELYAGQRVIFHPLRGYDAEAQQAEQLLAVLFPESPDPFQTFCQGLQITGQQPGDYSSSMLATLAPDMPAIRASRQIHLQLLQMMERNQPGLVAQIDTEFLHDFRIACRRTRSLLSLIDRQLMPARVVRKARRDFRLIGQKTNRARDLDVYLLALPAYKSLIPEEYRDFLDPFGDYLWDQRQQEQNELKTFLASRRYQKIVSSWHDFLVSAESKAGNGNDAMVPVMSIANRSIWKAYCRLLKKGRAIGRHAPRESYHELRIQGKKLRYLLEFMASLYPAEELTAAIKALKKLQNVLGEFQDAVVQSQAIRRYGGEMAETGIGSPETLMAMGMVAETIVQREQVALAAFREAFDRFSRKANRTLFAGLFAEHS